jgi:hypothetical protein
MDHYSVRKKQTRVMLLAFSTLGVLLLLGSSVAIGLSNGVPTASATTETTVSHDTRGTYLRLGSTDASFTPTTINLIDEGFAPGDTVTIAFSGTWRYICSNVATELTAENEAGTHLIAVFSSSDTLLAPNASHRVPDAIDAGADYATLDATPTGEATDIPEDFRIVPNTGFEITIPSGASYLFLSMSDTHFVDNCGSMSVTITKPNLIPTADLSASQTTINEGETSSLDASGSNDPDSGDSLTYTFEILNGGVGTITGQSDANDATATYNAPSDVSSDQTVTIQMTVDDGNGGSDTATIDILVKDVPAPTTQYTVNGFYSPVDMIDSNGDPMINTIKSGKSVALKFEIFDNSNVEQTSTSVIQSFKQNKINCNSLSGEAQDAIEITNTGGTDLRYDSNGGIFIQNWKTPSGQAGNCYSATVTTTDGSSITAYFMLK